MNYNFDTHILPQMNYLRVCLSCWSRLPSSLGTCARLGQMVRQCPYSNVTCSFNCGLRWSSLLASSSRKYSSQSEKKDAEFDISKNPFYDKYQTKLKHLESSSPDEFQSKLGDLGEKRQQEAEQRRKELAEAAKEARSKPQAVGAWPPKNLDEIMKLDLIQDKSQEEIEEIWTDYHKTKDCVFGILKEIDYDDLREKTKLCPSFVFPLPRNDGFEFILTQFFGNEIYFTPLAMFQLLKENAPPCLSLFQFTELKETKGLVLMLGQYDKNVLKKSEALNLVRQLKMYYGRAAGDHFNLVRMFNHTPESFKYMDLVDNYKTVKEFLESS